MAHFGPRPQIISVAAISEERTKKAFSYIWQLPLLLKTFHFMESARHRGYMSESIRKNSSADDLQTAGRHSFTMGKSILGMWI